VDGDATTKWRRTLNRSPVRLPVRHLPGGHVGTASDFANADHYQRLTWTSGGEWRMLAAVG